MEELRALRQRIDDADRDLIEALARRMEAVDHILREKEAQGLELFDLDREKSLLSKVAGQASSRRLDPKLVERVLREVISHSRELQMRRVQQERNPGLKRIARVGFQGAAGAYSWQALRKAFSKEVEAFGYPSFREVVQALEEGRLDLALLPIENTLFGSIHEVYELLSTSRLSVVGEEVLRIEHCLLGLESTPLGEIRAVLSHPVALQQCGTFLRGMPKATCQSYIDTAEAVRKVKREGDPRQAAIASKAAGQRYGLMVLREGISDHPENFTRFWLISRQPAEVDARIPAKTSLLLVTDHREGALVQCLSALRDHGVNMTKLESRPRRGAPWQYQFYLDLEGHLDSDPMQQALEQVRERARLLRVLGCYPRIDVKEGVPYLSEALDAEERRREVRRNRNGHSRPLHRPSRQAAAVAVGSAQIGGGGFAVLAGPVRYASGGELEQAAEAAESCGVDVLLGGEYLAQDGDETLDPVIQGARLASRQARKLRLPAASQVDSDAQVETLANLCDLLIVGGRNMQNYPLLRLLGRLAKPVLLERGISSTVDELLASADQILAEGNQQVILCERGIRTFEAANRETLDLGAVLALKERTHLPVMVNPMSAAASAGDVLSLCRAARAVGADGVVVHLGGGDRRRPMLDVRRLADLMSESHS